MEVLRDGSENFLERAIRVECLSSSKRMITSALLKTVEERHTETLKKLFRKKGNYYLSASHFIKRQQRTVL